MNMTLSDHIFVLVVGLIVGITLAAIYTPPEA